MSGHVWTYLDMVGHVQYNAILGSRVQGPKKSESTFPPPPDPDPSPSSDSSMLLKVTEGISLSFSSKCGARATCTYLPIW